MFRFVMIWDFKSCNQNGFIFPTVIQVLQFLVAITDIRRHGYIKAGVLFSIQE